MLRKKIIVLCGIIVLLAIPITYGGIWLFSYHLTNEESSSQLFLECENANDRYPGTDEHDFDSKTGMYHLEVKDTISPAADKKEYIIKGSVSGGSCHIVETNENGRVLLDITLVSGTEYDETITVFDCGKQTYTTYDYTEDVFGDKSISITIKNYAKGYNLLD